MSHAAPFRDPRRCRASTVRGRRCANEPLPDSPYCYYHCGHSLPDAAAAEIVSNSLRLDTVEGIHALLSRVMRQLTRGRIQPRKANAIFYAAQIMLASVERLREERERVFCADSDQALKHKALFEAQVDALETSDVLKRAEEIPASR
jgi:hypothetical protein